MTQERDWNALASAVLAGANHPGPALEDAGVPIGEQASVFAGLVDRALVDREQVPSLLLLLADKPKKLEPRTVIRVLSAPLLETDFGAAPKDAERLLHFTWAKAPADFDAADFPAPVRDLVTLYKGKSGAELTEEETRAFERGLAALVAADGCTSEPEFGEDGVWYAWDPAPLEDVLAIAEKATTREAFGAALAKKMTKSTSVLPGEVANLALRHGSLEDLARIVGNRTVPFDSSEEQDEVLGVLDQRSDDAEAFYAVASQLYPEGDSSLDESADLLALAGVARAAEEAPEWLEERLQIFSRTYTHDQSSAVRWMLAALRKLPRARLEARLETALRPPPAHAAPCHELELLVAAMGDPTVVARATAFRQLDRDEFPWPS